MKTKYSSLIKAINQIGIQLKNEEQTKVGKKLTKIVKIWQKHIDTYNDKLEEIRLDLASVDSKDNLILDEKGNYIYNKANTKLLNEKVKALLDEEFEFEPIIVSAPQGLEKFSFLKDYLVGVDFIEEEDVEL